MIVFFSRLILFAGLLHLLQAGDMALHGQSERDFYGRDFYLQMDRFSESQNEDAGSESVQRDGEDREGSAGPSDDEWQIAMSDDGFIVPPECRRREELFLLYVLPGLMGLLTLSLAWVCWRNRLREKQEIYQTRRQLQELRKEFRGRENTMEFRDRLKEILKLPPGATTRQIRQAIPFSDRQIQQIIGQHDEQFKRK